MTHPGAWGQTPSCHSPRLYFQQAFRVTVATPKLPAAPHPLLALGDYGVCPVTSTDLGQSRCAATCLKKGGRIGTRVFLQSWSGPAHAGSPHRRSGRMWSATGGLEWPQMPPIRDGGVTGDSRAL